jgi:hypothetical protein
VSNDNTTPAPQADLPQNSETKLEGVKAYEKPAFVEYTNIFTDAFAY